MSVKVCPVCGQEFNATTNKKYCSAKCARIAQTEKNYHNIRKRTDLKAKQNPDLLYAFDFKCAVCGWSLPAIFENLHQYQRGCQFHHIVPVCEGGSNTEENLVLLCPNCHKMAHTGMISRKTLLGLTHTKEEARKIREEKEFLDKCRGAELIDLAF